MRCLMLFLLTLATLAHAAHPKKNPLTQNGLTYEITGQTINIYVDPSKANRYIKQLQKQRLIDPRFSSAEINNYQPWLYGSVSLNFTAKILQHIYSDNQTIDQTHTNVYINAIDNYGNLSKNFCYGFDFNRELYQKINWANFQPINLTKIAPNFQLSELCRSITLFGVTAGY